MTNHKFNTRCFHCAGPLSKEMETSEWTVAPLMRDTFSMIGTAVGGTSSAFYGFNHELIPISFTITNIVDEKILWIMFKCILILPNGTGRGRRGVMPIVQKRIRGPMLVHFLVGAPPVIIFSSACAGLAGGAVPALAQLASTSYRAAVASSSSLPPQSPQNEKLSKPRSASTV
ncbi:hypothetical protein LIER_20006 [Lithospermum erythrorhizon]|uniref:Uncharacterized protein n=1 Tax=Lithospermum erythrorhizon TaxID=34254 RepID=A0AAV3QNI8_LITER